MFRLRTAGLLLATALAATAVGTPPAAAGIFFVGSGNEFGTINPVTGAITTLGTASTDTGNSSIFGMGFSNGVLYGLDGGDLAEPIAHLFRINTANGATTDLGSTGQTVDGATTNSAGVLFAANFNISSPSPSTLYRVSPPSPVATTIGGTGFIADGLMAFDGAGNLFASARRSRLKSFRAIALMKPNRFGELETLERSVFRHSRENLAFSRLSAVSGRRFDVGAVRRCQKQYCTCHPNTQLRRLGKAS